MYEFMFEFSAQFHWSLCLFSFQYHAIFITIALENNFMSGMLIPLAVLEFFVGQYFRMVWQPVIYAIGLVWAGHIALQTSCLCITIARMCCSFFSIVISVDHLRRDVGWSWWLKGQEVCCFLPFVIWRIPYRDANSWPTWQLAYR